MASSASIMKTMMIGIPNIETLRIISPVNFPGNGGHDFLLISNCNLVMLKRYVQAEFIGQGEESTVAIPANVAFS